MGAHGVYFVLYLLALISAVVKAADLERRMLEASDHIRQRRSADPVYAEEFDAEFSNSTEVRIARHLFECPTLLPSPTVPTSVHKLRPGDIQVVCALGDSITAGRGINEGLLGLLIDNRGLSWSIGGDKDYFKAVTLPNILRQYNPDLYGFSKGTGKSHAKFNVAVSGAKSSSGLSQAQELLRLLKADSKVNMDTDWKLITIFIGGNDLCDWCENVKAYSSESYKKNLKAILDFLDANFKRTFVNLVEMINVEFVTKMKQNVLCTTVLKIICECGAFPDSKTNEAKLLKLREEYQAVARELANSEDYKTRDDFAVVLQPFYRNTTVPTKPDGKVDLSYFAADCFHQSRKGHEAAAEALWNNMIEPVGFKRTAWTPGEPIECPTEDYPYLYTAQNSKRRRRP